mmetsp:Transcript_81446/g.161706  ORF Transcript_81446/g.161706 Transcript_81446/m.161706 type:complete len:210 (-) Transcript_81446:477-1106(-)
MPCSLWSPSARLVGTIPSGSSAKQPSVAKRVIFFGLRLPFLSLEVCGRVPAEALPFRLARGVFEGCHRGSCDVCRGYCVARSSCNSGSSALNWVVAVFPKSQETTHRLLLLPTRSWRFAPVSHVVSSSFLQMTNLNSARRSASGHRIQSELHEGYSWSDVRSTTEDAHGDQLPSEAAEPTTLNSSPGSMSRQSTTKHTAGHASLVASGR